MELIRPGQAGSVESSDILILIGPNDKGKGIEWHLESPVKNIYGDKIKQEIEEVLHKYKIRDAIVQVTDRGALPFTVKARAEAAILRAIKKD